MPIHAALKISAEEELPGPCAAIGHLNVFIIADRANDNEAKAAFGRAKNCHILAKIQYFLKCEVTLELIGNLKAMPARTQLIVVVSENVVACGG